MRAGQRLGGAAPWLVGAMLASGIVAAPAAAHSECEQASLAVDCIEHDAEGMQLGQEGTDEGAGSPPWATPSRVSPSRPT